MTAIDAALVRDVQAAIAARGVDPSPGEVAAELRRDGRVVGDRTVLAIVDRLRREASGLGPLEALAREPGVTDVLVNGVEGVYADRGAGLEPVAEGFDHDDDVRRFAQRLAARAGRRLDDATPYVDARLPDGTRLHAVLAPIAWPGTTVSLRIPACRRFSLDDLVTAGLTDATGRSILHRLVESRAALLITGGAGAGKTTLLAALLGLADEHERLVIVEDSRELRPDHPHVVSLEARPPNVEGTGLVSLRDLVRQALRMRPDRLVVGEVRGAEIVDLLAAMNTGHDGGAGTIHANSVHDVPARVEALGVAAGLSRAGVHSQLVSALDVVVHVARDATGRRRITQIAALERDGGETAVVPLAERDASGCTRLTAVGARRFEGSG